MKHDEAMQAKQNINVQSCHCIGQKEATVDNLDAEEIRSLLTGSAANCQLTVYPTISSTNDALKKEAQNAAPHGTIIIAEEQTSGRGRRGKTFFSPLHSGLYISLLVRPTLASDRALFLTTATAVAVAEVLEQFSGKETQIKWVNDIYIEGKKCAGILTEASVNPKTGLLDFAVIGIGINCFAPDNGFPAEIADRACAVFDHPGKYRSALAAALIRAILTRINGIESDKTGNSGYLEEYRHRSFLTGKEITILSDPPIDAICRGIDDSCALLAVLPDGTEKRIAAGDVSIRLPNPR